MSTAVRNAVRVVQVYSMFLPMALVRLFIGSLAGVQDYSLVHWLEFKTIIVISWAAKASQLSDFSFSRMKNTSITVVNAPVRCEGAQLHSSKNGRN